MKNNEPVVRIPRKANKPRKSFFLFVMSAKAPKNGAIQTMANPDTELAVPSQTELSGPDKSPAQ